MAGACAAYGSLGCGLDVFGRAPQQEKSAGLRGRARCEQEAPGGRSVLAGCQAPGAAGCRAVSVSNFFLSSLITRPAGWTVQSEARRSRVDGARTGAGGPLSFGVKVEVVWLAAGMMDANLVEWGSTIKSRSQRRPPAALVSTMSERCQAKGASIHDDDRSAFARKPFIKLSQSQYYSTDHNTISSNHDRGHNEQRGFGSSR